MDSVKDSRYRALISFLRKARKQQQMTQAQLGNALGLQQSCIAKIENYERRLDIVELITLFDVLQIDPIQAFRESRVIPPAQPCGQTYCSLSTSDQALPPLPFYFFVIDCENKTILHSNELTARFYGLSLETFLGQPLDLFSLQPAQELAMATSFEQTSLAPSPFISRHTPLDGSIRIIEMLCSPIIQQENKKVCWFFFRDISDEMREELQLQSQKSLIKNLLNSVPYGIFIKDLQGRYIAANEIFSTFIGQSSIKIINSTDSDLFPEGVAKEEQAKDNQIIQKNFKTAYSFTLEQANSQKSTVMMVKNPVYNDQKQIIGIMGSFIPDSISNNELSDLLFTARFKDIFKNIPAPICISKLENGQILEANAAFFETLSLPSEKVIGKTSVEIGLLTPQARDAIIQTLAIEPQAELGYHMVDVMGNLFQGHLTIQKIRFDDREFLLTIALKETRPELQDRCFKTVAQFAE